jgi:hypothetical protein
VIGFNFTRRAFHGRQQETASGALDGMHVRWEALATLVSTHASRAATHLKTPG